MADRRSIRRRRRYTKESVSYAAEALQSGVVTWWAVQSVTKASVVTATGCGSWQYWLLGGDATIQKRRWTPKFNSLFSGSYFVDY